MIGFTAKPRLDSLGFAFWKTRLVLNGNHVAGVVSQSGRAGIVILADGTIPLHHVVELVGAGHGEGRAVVVATGLTGIGSGGELGVAGGVANNLPLLTFVGDVARREEHQELAVHVAQDAADVGHIVLVLLNAAGAGVSPALGGAVVFGSHLTRACAEINAEALQGRTGGCGVDDVQIGTVMDANGRNVVGVKRNNHAVVAQTGGILLALGCSGDDIFQNASHSLFVFVCDCV